MIIYQLGSDKPTLTKQTQRTSFQGTKTSNNKIGQQRSREEATKTMTTKGTTKGSKYNLEVRDISASNIKRRSSSLRHEITKKMHGKEERRRGESLVSRDTRGQSLNRLTQVNNQVGLLKHQWVDPIFPIVQFLCSGHPCFRRPTVTLGIYINSIGTRPIDLIRLDFSSSS